ncbi:MAG: type II toxin-antitoxin system Phd/YefM family antitoxin [Deltaproteobacteria bacterium]|nr:type II toxin-antitoxin system Phd/YefM family antitoxin [Deltaproteobacteria bacterium]
MQVTSAEFRTNCFKILDKIEQTHEEVVITKRGKPIAKLVHIDNGDKKDPFLGTLAGLGRTLGDLTEPVAEANEWELD